MTMTARDVVYASQDLRAWASVLDVPASSMPGASTAERSRRASDLETAAAGTVDQAARIAIAVHPVDPARAERIVTTTREFVVAPEWDDVLGGGEIDEDDRSRLWERIHTLLRAMGDPLTVLDGASVPPVVPREDAPRPAPRRAAPRPVERDDASDDDAGPGIGAAVLVFALGGLFLASRRRG